MPKRKQKAPRYVQPSVEYLPREWWENGFYEEDPDGVIRWKWELPWYVRFQPSSEPCAKYLRLFAPGEGSM